MVANQSATASMMVNPCVPRLGTAGNYSILTKALSNTSPTTPSTTNGDVSAEAITTFPVQLQGSTDQSGGSAHQTAMTDLRSAIDNGLALQGGTPYSDATNVIFTPGLYTQTPPDLTSVAGSTITLDGAGDYLFQIAGAFTPGAHTKVVLINGANPDNIYWIFGRSFTLGAAIASFQGNLLARENITFGDSTELQGRALSLIAVNISTTKITSPTPVVKAPLCNLHFTDTTLDPVTVGAPYSDFISAFANIGAVPSGSPITYSVVPPLPSGLTLNSLNGVISGTVPETSTAVTQMFSFTASSPGYPSVPVSIALVMTNRPTKVIVFTDTTLKDVTIGEFYSDTITAEARTGEEKNNDPITYSVDNATPLPSGLNLNSLTGVIDGTVSTDAAVGSSRYIFIVSSPSYPSPTFPVTLIVKAKTPDLVLSLFFTDKTLVDAVTGVSYSDTLTAVGMTGTGASTPSPLVTYALVSTSHLPGGLLLNTSTGVVSGRPTTIETRTVVITASASGYLSQSESIRIIVTTPVATTPVATTPVATTPVATTPVATTPVVNTTVVSPALTVAQVVPPFDATVNKPPAVSTDVAAPQVVADTVVIPGTDLQNSSETDNSVVETKVVKKPINTLMMTALFGNNSSQLDLKTKAAIKSMVIKMKKLNIDTLTIAGFSSSAGGVDNVKLSVARAKSLATELVKNGVKNKITLKGLGVMPSANSLAALALTRKAEIWVLLKA
jgi:outer membrane protein OmpA-like peptidoglycan-associated protein